MWNAKTKVIPVIKRGDWNHLKIPQKRTGKAQNQGTRENSYTGHCTHRPKSTKVKMRQTWERTLKVSKIVTTEQWQQYMLYKHSLFEVYNCKYPA